MNTTEPTADLLFSEADATPFSTDEKTLKPWSQAQKCLEAASRIWITTVRKDGRPHTAPVLLLWRDDTAYVTSRPSARKAQNLLDNEHCTIVAQGDDLDLTAEGVATPITGESDLEQVASAFKEKYGWPFAVRDGKAYDESLPGPPEYAFWKVEFVRAFGYGPEGKTATRWRFA
jgi:pyridoxine/pyridoxamine 5'-phosphate oxidase